MRGETAFSLGVWAGVQDDDPGSLLRGWEAFALPIAEAPASGGGSLARSASLLDDELDLGEAQLSNVRRRAGVVEVRMWNPRNDREAGVSLGGTSVTVGPARIETVTWRGEG